MPKTYIAIDDIYHYPDGVLAVGESAELSEEHAARGLASGALAEVADATPAPPNSALTKTQEPT